MIPLVTVVIPSYNHAPFVDCAITSVLAQTVRDLELIVIDDGSRDDSVARIRTTLANCGDARARLVTRANRGLCRTLNEGLLQAQGSFFAYLGSDDQWAPIKLARQLSAMDAVPQCAAAFSDCHVIDSKGLIRDQFRRQYPYRGGDIYSSLLWSEFHPPSPTNLFRTNVLLQVGGFNERLPIEDRDLWLRLARNFPVVYVPEPLACFRVHSTNTGANHPERMRGCNAETLEWILRTDPTVKPWRRWLTSRNHSWYAAALYNYGDHRAALAEALRALRMFAGEPLAWRVIALSAAAMVLGRNLLHRLRGHRVEAP